MMTITRETQWAAWAGIIALPLGVIPAFITDDFPAILPRWNSTAEQITAWFADHRASALTQIHISNIQLLLLIWFAAGLGAALHDQTGRIPLIARLILPSAVVITALWLTVNALWALAALAGTAGHTYPPELVRYSFDAAVLIWLTAMPVIALTLLASAAAIRQTRALPAWTAWTAWTAIALSIPTFFSGFLTLPATAGSHQSPPPPSHPPCCSSAGSAPPPSPCSNSTIPTTHPSRAPTPIPPPRTQEAPDT
jgi:hypothetical protein